MSDRVRSWVTGMERDLFRYLVRDWLECLVQGLVRALETRLNIEQEAYQFGEIKFK